MGNDGGPAFPVIETETPHAAGTTRWFDVRSVGGMSLRDYFGAQALQCLPEGAWRDVIDDSDERRAAHALAEAAYSVADAMLAIRASKP